MPDSRENHAALLVDVENLFYAQSRKDGDLARACLVALDWWSRDAVKPARLLHREGYSKRVDPSYRPLVGAARRLRFALLTVPSGPDKAELQVVQRLNELTDAGYRRFVVGGVDRRAVSRLRALHRVTPLQSWLVVPTSYKRKDGRRAFGPGGKNADLEVQRLVWIDEVLVAHKQSQREPVSGPSPFSGAGGFWRVMHPATVEIGSATWMEAAERRFLESGFSPVAAKVLPVALRDELLRTHHEKLAQGFAPNPRNWARLCLVSLLRAYLDYEAPGAGQSEFHEQALRVGSAHVSEALSFAERTSARAPHVEE